MRATGEEKGRVACSSADRVAACRRPSNCRSNCDWRAPNFVLLASRAKTPAVAKTYSQNQGESVSGGRDAVLMPSNIPSPLGSFTVPSNYRAIESP